MSRRGLRRPTRTTLAFIGAVCLFLAGMAGTTSGFFDGETDNPVTVAGGWVERGTNPMVTIAGYDDTITWSHGVTGISSQAIYGADVGTTTNCTSATFTAVTTNIATNINTYVDTVTANPSGSSNGNYYCYQVVGVHGPWTTPTVAAVQQIGLGLKSVTFANGGTSGKIDNKDLITLTFNQKPATPANGTVCTFQGASGSGVILIGDSTCSNKTTDTWVIAQLTNLTVGGTANSHQKLTGTVTISNTAPWTMQIKVGQNGQTVSGTASFLGSTSVASSAGGSHLATLCQTANANCQPTPTGSF